MLAESRPWNFEDRPRAAIRYLPSKEQRSAAVVADDKSLKLNITLDDERTITWNGKFNVHTTADDVC
jgi:hypothetical protein